MSNNESDYQKNITIPMEKWTAILNYLESIKAGAFCLDKNGALIVHGDKIDAHQQTEDGNEVASLDYSTEYEIHDIDTVIASATIFDTSLSDDESEMGSQETRFSSHEITLAKRSYED